MSTTANAVLDLLVLVAIERAARHSPPGIQQAPTLEVTAHLALSRRSRRIFAQLDAVEAAGLLERSRLHRGRRNIVLWRTSIEGTSR
jgi:hypothetical protein